MRRLLIILTALSSLAFAQTKIDYLTQVKNGGAGAASNGSASYVQTSDGSGAFVGSVNFQFDGTALKVGQPTLLTNNPLAVAGTVNGFLQAAIQNKSNGASASSDFVATADSGNDSSNYCDFGINSSAYSDTSYTVGGALSGYVYCNGGDLTVGTQTAAKVIYFHTGGTLLANRRVSVTDTALSTLYSGAGKVLMTADSGGGSTALMAPATTTSNAALVWTLPQADAVGAIASNGSGALTIIPVPSNYEVTGGSDFATTGTGFTNVTGLGWPIAATTTQTFDCLVGVKDATTSVGIVLGFTGPASPTTVTIRSDLLLTSQTALTVQGSTGSSWPASIPTTACSSSCLVSFKLWTIHGIVVNGANAGTVQLQAKVSSGTGYVQRASACWIH